MKHLYLSILLITIVLQASGQENIELSIGPAYSNQSFYDLSTNEIHSIPNETWDISFSVFGLQDASIFVNEATSSTGTELLLYELAITNFTDPITEEDLTTRIFNDEQSWLGGAFNNSKDPDNLADYGWGSYDPTTNSVTGNKIFVIELRNGDQKRIQIVSLVGSIYLFRYANLDGSQVQEITIDKNQFSGKHLAYFSFSTESVLDLEPDEWDLLFTRYSSPIPDGSGVILDYVVTGVLSAKNISIAEANGVDPFDVDEEDFNNDYSSKIDVIGFDWKAIDLSTFQWNVVEDRVYFVKTESGQKYKLLFYDFEGSSTGTISFEKTTLLSTSSTEVKINLATIGEISPNPNRGNFSFSLDNKFGNSNAQVSIWNMAGQKVYNSSLALLQGNQMIHLQTDIKKGNYILKIKLNNSYSCKKLSIQ